MPKILILSRDRGSVQTTVPVAAALAARADFSLAVYTYQATEDLWSSAEISAKLFDEEAFSLNPQAAIRVLLDAEKPDLILSGSSRPKASLPETPEQHLILEARKREILSVGILDFWGFYEQRFGVDLSLVPDHLCVLDKRCSDDLAALGISRRKMEITHNPWLDALVAAGAKKPEKPAFLSEDKTHFLFVSQPIAEMRAQTKLPYDQEDVLDCLSGAIARAGLANKTRVWIWLHPAEDKERWQNSKLLRHPEIELAITATRGRGFLAHIDALVSSHSTVAYEALYEATPCLSVRPKGRADPAFILDGLGLCPLFFDEESLSAFLAKADWKKERRRIETEKERLAKEGVFFSDGQATRRIVSFLERILSKREGKG